MRYGIKACREEAKRHHRSHRTVRTLLAGDESQVAPLAEALGTRKVWPPDKFFRAKYNEQLQRHKQYHNVEYNLEPNIKTSPGGLRDIHGTVICQRKFTTRPQQFIDLGVLSPTEANWLVEGKRFICWVFGLHHRRTWKTGCSSLISATQRLGFVDRRTIRRRAIHAPLLPPRTALMEANDIPQHFTEVVKVRAKKLEPINERFQITIAILGAPRTYSKNAISAAGDVRDWLSATISP